MMRELVVTGLAANYTSINSALAWFPLLIVVVAFPVFCLHRRVPNRRGPLPAGVGVGVICLISVPLGGIVYLVIGKKR